MMSVVLKSSVAPIMPLGASVPEPGPALAVASALCEDDDGYDPTCLSDRSLFLESSSFYERPEISMMQELEGLFFFAG